MAERLRVIVIGAGAWGLPAATELARRGHAVTLIDARGPGNAWASSHGATRIWRIAHPDRVRVRWGLRSIDAWHRAERRAGRPLTRTTGLLWRGLGHEHVAEAVRAEGGEVLELAAREVGSVYRGLQPDDRDAVWTPQGGIVLAAEAIAAFAQGFEAAGGTIITARVAEIAERSGGVAVSLATGEVREADRVVVAAGPWAGELLASLGLMLPLRPVVQQVTYVGGTVDETLPCVIEGYDDDPDSVVYALPTPGRGLKIGLEEPLRELDPSVADDDRSPSPLVVERAVAHVRRMLPDVDPTVSGSDVCTWTYGPDGRFVIDTLAGGRAVVAVGDAGEGFKFSALMGEVLADLAEGIAAPPDVAEFSLARFGGEYPAPPERTTLDH